MTDEEIQQKYARGIEYLQRLEVIVKEQEMKFEKHLEEIAMLQFLVERLKELRSMEIGNRATSDVPPLDEPVKE